MNGQIDKAFHEEKWNKWTHLIGVVFALSSIWMAWPAVSKGWQWAFGVIFFISGMFLMFLSSTIYHWLKPGLAKDILRRCDHISIYVMIACSYTPICVAVVGGWVGWTVFGLLWAVVAGGTVYKILAIGKYPKLSLALYLLMGWSAVFIVKPVYDNLPPLSMFLIVAEGILYTAGTYFFAHDYHKHYHAIWHIFVLMGAIAHWSAILSLII